MSPEESQAENSDKSGEGRVEEPMDEEGLVDDTMAGPSDLPPASQCGEEDSGRDDDYGASNNNSDDGNSDGGNSNEDSDGNAKDNESADGDGAGPMAIATQVLPIEQGVWALKPSVYIVGSFKRYMGAHCFGMEVTDEDIIVREDGIDSGIGDRHGRA